jgi:hypothetical protein
LDTGFNLRFRCIWQSAFSGVPFAAQNESQRQVRSEIGARSKAQSAALMVITFALASSLPGIDCGIAFNLTFLAYEPVKMNHTKDDRQSNLESNP